MVIYVLDKQYSASLHVKFSQTSANQVFQQNKMYEPAYVYCFQISLFINALHFLNS